MSDVRVLGEGPTPADVMIVGQNPGRYESIHGRPFVGPSGRDLDIALSKRGIPRSKCYVTNAVKTYYPGNPKLTPKQINAERPELIEEVHRVSPRVILAVGGPAVKALTGRGGVEEALGKELALSADFRHDATVIATYHPAALMRNPAWGKAYEAAFDHFARVVRRDFAELEIVYKINEPMPAAEEAYLDVETSAGDLCLVGLRPRGGVCYLYTRASFDRARAALLGVRKVVAWQAAFDVEQVEHALGVHIYAFDDPMLKVYLLDESAKQDLKSNAMSRLGVASWEHGIRDRLVRGEQPIDEALFAYNARDLTYMEAVDRLLVLPPELQRVYDHLLIPATRVFMDAKARGIFISEEEIARARTLCRLVREEARVKVHAMIGEFTGPSGGPSPKRIAKALYQTLGLPVPEWTDSGSPATGKLALKKLRGKHDVIDPLLRYKEAEKLAEFVELYQDIRDANGRVHPTTFTTFTVTGRTSNADPNIQQLPRNDVVRRIVAASPGNALVIADQSQIELRVAAVVAPERRMLQAFRAGEDLHRLMAAKLTGKRPEDVTKAERYFAKPVNFGYLFGAEEYTFQQQALKDYDIAVSDDEATRAYDAFHRMYPDLIPWYKRVADVLRRQGYVESMFGRRRRLPGIESDDEYVRLEALRQGVNALVQSAASDIMLLCAIMLHEQGAPITAYIHDALIMEVPKEDADIWMARTKEVMERSVIERMRKEFCIDFPCPLVADCEVATRWRGVEVPHWQAVEEEPA
jgi:uracil-DNA glycosylase family 4